MPACGHGVSGLTHRREGVKRAVSEEEKNENREHESEITETGENAAAAPLEATIAETPANGCKKRKPPKYLLAVIVALAAVLVALATVLIVNLTRDRRAPELAEVKERFTALIEASHGVNTVLFGCGLPTYPRVYEQREPHAVTFHDQQYTIYTYTFEDSEIGTVVGYQYYVRVPEDDGEGNTHYVAYDIATGAALGSGYALYRFAEKTTEAREGAIYAANGYYYYDLPDYKEPDFYYTADDYPDYDYVRDDSPYHSTAEIREAAAAVYASAYLRSVTGALFDGAVGAADDPAGTILAARYIDYRKDGIGYLMQSNAVKGHDLPARRYDYDTMRVAKGSNSKYVKIEIESYIEGDEQDRVTVKLAFAKENGVWLLDSPTY